MFKAITIYGIKSQLASDALSLLDYGLQHSTFQPCGASQERSAGWVPPRGEANGAMVEAVGGQWIARFMVEAKAVPGDVLRRKVEERVAQIEKESGRKPGRKETKELKEDCLLQLLPMAFTKQSATLVWLDPKAHKIIVGSASSSATDEIITALVEALPGLVVVPLYTAISPTAVMADWLVNQEPAEQFSIDRECELKAADETKATIRYAHHPLDIEEISKHIEVGKLPTCLALTWQDRVSFLLSNSGQLKKIAFLEGVFEGRNDSAVDGFDADVAISTGELAQLIPDLIAALGGEHPGA